MSDNGSVAEKGSVATKIENGVGSVCFEHPKGNSLPGTLLAQIAEEIKKLGRDDQVQVIVLRSKGEKTFCGGASFAELRALKTPADGLAFFSGFARVIVAIKEVPKFVIARVQGKAIGGGVGLVAACDYAIAHNSASVRLSELALGLGPFVIGPAVQRKVGLANFSKMAIDCDWHTAEWAAQAGLYSSVHAKVEAVDHALFSLTKQLSTYNPDAMRQLKHIFWAETEHWPKYLEGRAEISGTLALSKYTQTAIAKAAS